MERKRYERSKHGVRRILHYLNEEDMFERKIDYRFGLVLHPEIEQFLLYDCKPNKIIGAIKADDKIIVRYDPASEWQEEICKFRMDDRKSVLVPSETLNKYLDMVRSVIGNRCTREVESFEAFLTGDIETPSLVTHTWTFPRILEPQLTTPQTPFGQYPEMTEERISINFPNSRNIRQDREASDVMLRELNREGIGLTGNMTYEQLIGHYQSYQNDRRGMLEMERQMARRSRVMPMFYGEAVEGTAINFRQEYSQEDVNGMLEAYQFAMQNRGASTTSATDYFRGFQEVSDDDL